MLIIGSGWGAVSLLRDLAPPPGTSISVVSPRGTFLYTPLLPAATVGSVEARSITEPIRNLLPPGAVFYEAAATTVDPSARTVSCVSAHAPTTPFTLPYDTLVLAPGSVANSFGTPGVEAHARTLKSFDDVVNLRAAIHDRFEAAALPGVAPDARDRLLSFVICGGGPTGVELAAELADAFAPD